MKCFRLALPLLLVFSLLLSGCSSAKRSEPKSTSIPTENTNNENIMREIDSRVTKVKDSLNHELYKDLYDREILVYRYFERGVESKSLVTNYLFYDEQGKLIYAEIAHYRAALYNVYFNNDKLLHVEVGPINGDMTNVKAVIKKDSSYAFVLEDISLCLEHAYKDKQSTEMNLTQIKAGNYSSLQGTWKEVAYAENVYDGNGVQWKKGLPASSATLSVSSDKIVYNDLVVIKGSTLTVTIDNGDPAGSHPLEFFIDNDGSLGAELADADKVAINWGVYFYPKGVKNDLEPNNGAKIDNTKNLIVIWTSNMGLTVVFAQTNAKGK